MRLVTVLFTALLLAPLGGCGDDSSSDTMDLSVSGESCLQVITCAQGCGTNATCATACTTKGTTAAQAKFQAVLTCAYGQCTVAKDGGAAACSNATDTSAGCAACLAAAGQAPACMTQLNACLGS